MGITKEQKTEEKHSLKAHSNPIKHNVAKIQKSEFYSFLQELNCKIELGLE